MGLEEGPGLGAERRLVGGVVEIHGATAPAAGRSRHSRTRSCLSRPVRAGRARASRGMRGILPASTRPARTAVPQPAPGSSPWWRPWSALDAGCRAAPTCRRRRAAPSATTAATCSAARRLQRSEQAHHRGARARVRDRAAADPRSGLSWQPITLPNPVVLLSIGSRFRPCPHQPPPRRPPRSVLDGHGRGYGHDHDRPTTGARPPRPRPRRRRRRPHHGDGRSRRAGPALRRSGSRDHRRQPALRQAKPGAPASDDDVHRHRRRPERSHATAAADHDHHDHGRAEQPPTPERERLSRIRRWRSVVELEARAPRPRRARAAASSRSIAVQSVRENGKNASGTATAASRPRPPTTSIGGVG